MLDFVLIVLVIAFSVVVGKVVPNKLRQRQAAKEERAEILKFYKSPQFTRMIKHLNTEQERKQRRAAALKEIKEREEQEKQKRTQEVKAYFERVKQTQTVREFIRQAEAKKSEEQQKEQERQRQAAAAEAKRKEREAREAKALQDYLNQRAAKYGGAN